MSRYKQADSTSSYDRSKSVADSVNESRLKASHPIRAYRDCNAVAQDAVFRQRVDKERQASSLWQERWSFLTQVDQHGRPRTAPALPSKWAFFDEKPAPAPPTRQKEIGLAVRQPSATVRNLRSIERTDSRARKRTDIGSTYAMQS
eukprot:scpid96354/ scgid34197/ 